MNLSRNESTDKAPRGGNAAAGGVGIILALVLAFLVVGILALALWPKRPEKVEPVPQTLLPVAVQEVMRTNLEERVVLTGRVEAEKDVRLAVDDNGRILWLGADKGDRVHQGQLLLRLDDTVETAGVARAEVSLRQAAEDLDRWTAMQQAGAVSVQDFENVKNRRDLARIALEEARGLLAKRQVRSPVDGVINERLAEIGEMAMPGKPAFQVVKTDTVKVVVDIPERDVAAMRAGMPLAFTVDAIEAAAFTGAVVFVATAADAASLTFRLEIRADNPEGRLKPGMIARIGVSRGGIRDAAVVPLQALIPDQGQYVAYVETDGRAVCRIVKLAAVVDTLAVVQEGLQPGDRVIVAGHRLVTDGASVRVMP